MSKPFPQNAILILKTTGTVTVDEYGNPKNEPIIIEMEASIKQVRMGNSQILGWDSHEETPIEGRAIAPDTFPHDFQPRTICEATLNGNPCRIRIVPAIPSRWYDEAQILGQKFEGAIVSGQIWGNT